MRAAIMNAPCMVKGKCTKYFPKKFYEETFLDHDGFPIYKRRQNDTFVAVKGICLDNYFIVPYNRDLVVKLLAHINVEICNWSRLIKHLFKYINKGPDGTTIIIKVDSRAPIEQLNEQICLDKIKTYLGCRFVFYFYYFLLGYFLRLIWLFLFYFIIEVYF